MGISTFNPDMRVFIAQKPGRKWSASSSFLLFLLHLPSFPIISFVSLLPTAFRYHGLPIC